MMPYLWRSTSTAWTRAATGIGRKILPLGQGALDLDLLRIIRDSGYRGPIGILGHTMDDAEERLQDNLDGLDWLVPQLEGTSRRAAADAAHAGASAPGRAAEGRGCRAGCCISAPAAAAL